MGHDIKSTTTAVDYAYGGDRLAASQLFIRLPNDEWRPVRVVAEDHGYPSRKEFTVWNSSPLDTRIEFVTTFEYR